MAQHIERAEVVTDTDPTGDGTAVRTLALYTRDGSGSLAPVDLGGTDLSDVLARLDSLESRVDALEE